MKDQSIKHFKVWNYIFSFGFNFMNKIKWKYN